MKAQLRVLEYEHQAQVISLALDHIQYGYEINLKQSGETFNNSSCAFLTYETAKDLGYKGSLHKIKWK